MGARMASSGSLLPCLWCSAVACWLEKEMREERVPAGGGRGTMDRRSHLQRSRLEGWLRVWEP
jgi:hypothetical protein